MSKKLLMFSSKACGPCAAIKPKVIELQKKNGFELEIHALEEGAEIFAEHRIRAVPVIMAVNKSKEIGRLTGAMTDKALTEALTKWGIIDV